nr:vegetative cell wall protein gp1-like [Aegilops tauschii subsp. strangulata]
MSVPDRTNCAARHLSPPPPPSTAARGARSRPTRARGSSRRPRPARLCPPSPAPPFAAPAPRLGSPPPATDPAAMCRPSAGHRLRHSPPSPCRLPSRAPPRASRETVPRPVPSFPGGLPSSGALLLWRAGPASDLQRQIQ